MVEQVNKNLVTPEQSRGRTLKILSATLAAASVLGYAAWRGSKVEPVEDITFPKRELVLNYTKTFDDLSNLGKVLDRNRSVKFFELNATQAERLMQQAAMVLAGTESYTVKPGDSFEKLVKERLGNGGTVQSAYFEYQRVRSKLTGEMVPEKIKVGTVIQLPDSSASRLLRYSSQFPESMASALVDAVAQSVKGPDGKLSLKPNYYELPSAE